MTPAVGAARRAGIDCRMLEYEHAEGTSAFGREAAEALGLDPHRVFKTLVAELASGELVVAIVPVAARLDLKALAAAAGSKKAVMADPQAAERATGYVVGGISPLGQRRRLATVLDISALDQDRIYVSGGRRGLELCLRPEDLVALTDAATVPIIRREPG